MTAAPWLILRSLRMSEARRASWTNDLHVLGVETYYPLVRQNMRVPMRKLTPAQRSSQINLMRPRVVPFFPNSTFVRNADLAVIDDRRIAPSAVGFLAIGPELAKVPDMEISDLKRRELDGVIPGASSAEWKFEKGEVVWIVNGVFTGRRGIVETPPTCPLEEVDSDTKLTVALDLFGRETPVELTVGDLRKV